MAIARKEVLQEKLTALSANGTRFAYTADEALAMLDLFAAENTLAANRMKSARLNELLQGIAADPRIRDYRNRGMIWAFDAIVNDADKAASFSRRFHEAALKHELLLRPIGTTVYLMPPYVLDDDELVHLARATHSAFNEAMAA